MTEKEANTEPTAVALAVFYDRHIAMAAVNDLKRQKFYSHQIGVVSTDGKKRTRKNPDIVGRNHAKGAVAGLVSGAIIGAVAGIAFALVTGLTLMAGLLTGVITGAVVGVLLGALSGMGIPRRDPHYYDKPFDAGRSIVMVATYGRGAEAREILQRHGGRDLDERAAAVNVVGRPMVRTAPAPAPAATTNTPVTPVRPGPAA